MARRSPAEVRVRRLIAMTFRLAVRPADRRTLATDYGVSQRQITNDLAVLRAAGVEITHGDDGYTARLTGPAAGALNWLPILSSAEAATELGVRRNTVDTLVARGLLPATRVGGRLRFAPADVDRYGKRPRRRYAKPPRLSSDDVTAIRQRHAAGVGVQALARDYGVSRQSIYNVLNRTTWRDLLPTE